MASNTDYREDGNDFYARRSARHAQHLAARQQKTLEPPLPILLAIRDRACGVA
jgi:hypothetical protein